MDQATHNKIVSFIWDIADDVLRDLFKRGKYPDVILPMCVIRRMDAVLEPTKKKLLADFEDYLNGFSPNVQDILENFKFRNQLTTLSRADAIGTLINKFLDPAIDLSPAGIDNHAMGTVFEELVRKFNEDNNEEAGEHWTPRDAVRLMANLVFLPIESQIKSGTYMLYDCACGTGGMLTVAEETLTAIAAKRKQQVKSLLYGQEINPDTYAVCKADMLLKDEGESADHIVGGAEWSTLAHDAFPAQEFDFMLANAQAVARPESAFDEVVALIQSAREGALRTVNSELVGLYWQIGEYIHHKLASAEWGDGVVDELARYLAQTQPGLRGFTRPNLFRMKQFYETYSGDTKVSPLVRQMHPDAADIFKDSYVVEFLQLPGSHMETDLHR